MIVRFWGFAQTAFKWLTAFSTIAWLVSLIRTLYETGGALEDIVPRVSWSVIVGLAIVAALMLGGVLLSARLSTRALVREATRVAGEILAFLAERKSGDPAFAMFDYKPEENEETTRRRWQEHTNRIVAYLQDTMAEYTRRFSSQVLWLRDELAKRGVIDEEFELFYQHPTNPIGVGIVATRLGAMARRLR